MKELKIPAFITDLSNYLISIKNLSEVYVTNMTVTIEQFLKFINIHKLKNKYDSIEELTLNDIRALSNSDIYSFIYYLVECHYKINSRIVKIEHLRTFFEYLFTIKNNIFKEPLKKINCEKKVEQKLPNYLSLDESKRLISVYANSDKTNEIRDNAILHLFLNCGLRLSELRNLNVNDLDFDDNKFTIFGKGKKERKGYINEATRNALLKYLDTRKDIQNDLSNRNKPLFLSKYGIRISESCIKMIIKKAYTQANIDNDIYSVHTLRHTCATLLYISGIDIRTIQELLGHVQIDTTEIYTHLHDEKVMDAMLNHPLAQFKMSNALAFCA